ncbi:sensor histidine kinase [Rhizobium sp. PP-CC-3G-465]|uniref:sensor histidine kinase n=1 Tax=Rhizobium sp. PP-CC-3G-465 TaxID=2135648 RepID=UPI001049BCBD|nr:two-component system C4-dicarboxylate transport sensor histidine kinase DctB [Rhizobium sp. PP-CC-3G-465]
MHHPLQIRPKSAPRDRVLPWVVLGAFVLAGLMVAILAGSYLGREDALRTLEAQARTDTSLKVAHLRAVLERPRALPMLLARDRQLADTLERPDAERSLSLDRKLEEIVADTNAAVIYVIGRDGIAIASSNWQEPTSFVGNDYTFREYFTKAMAAGTAEHFALGSVSKRPGLYISQRIEGASGPLGVVVAKMEFDQIETDWSMAGRPTFVTDQNGVVLITSVPSWRFMAMTPLAPDSLDAIRTSLQFGDAPLTPVPITVLERMSPGVERVSAVMPGERQRDFLRLAVAVLSTGWSLDYLVETDAAVAASVQSKRLQGLAVVLPMAALAAFLLARRQQAIGRLARELAAREELERRVRERTEALTSARDRLEDEIAGHRATETKLQGVQQELVHANRLAILGQVAAGVAHEINQPLATIRAYADNARVFLTRAQTGPVDENLESIAALTDRIGSITDELKTFSRKGRAPAGPVSVRTIVESAVMLLKSRFAGRLDALQIGLPDADLLVLGDRVRLEQVLINLLQNALEALSGRSDARVDVEVETQGDDVLLHVRDNGPGISPDIMSALFTPFNTSKERGLGLGLVISRDILADYGGRIAVESSDRGAHFTIHLKRAEA